MWFRLLSEHQNYHAVQGKQEALEIFSKPFSCFPWFKGRTKPCICIGKRALSPSAAFYFTLKQASIKGTEEQWQAMQPEFFIILMPKSVMTLPRVRLLFDVLDHKCVYFWGMLSRLKSLFVLHHSFLPTLPLATQVPCDQVLLVLGNISLLDHFSPVDILIQTTCKAWIQLPKMQQNESRTLVVFYLLKMWLNSVKPKLD